MTAKVEKTTSKNNEFLEVASIDSFKLSIPIHCFNSISDHLKHEFAEVNTNTGEVANELEWKRKAVKILKNGAATHIRLENIKFDSLRSEDCVTILINSKLHHSVEYFNGITKTNIKDIYSYLMSLNLFKIDYKTFLTQSRCTDIDTKIDFEMTSSEYHKTLDYLKSIIVCPLNAKIRTSFKGVGNKGIEFNERKTTNYRTAPFLKIYHKGNDLNTQSLQFKNKYLKSLQTDNIIRIEATIKNAKHLKSYGYLGTSLNDILKLKPNQLKDIIGKSLQKYLPKVNVKKPKNITKTGMTPTDTALYTSMATIMELTNYSKEPLINLMLSNITHKVERYRMKQKLEYIFEDNIKGNETEKRITTGMNFLRILGIG